MHTVLAYLLLLVGAAVEGEVVLLSFAALSHAERLGLWKVMAVGALGNWAGSQVLYALARTKGQKWIANRLRSRPRLRAHFEQVMHRVRRNDFVLMASSRYLWGFRTVIPLSCGLSGMSAVRFTLANALGCALWAPPVALGGYFLGHAASVLLQRAERAEWLAIPVVLLGGAAIWAASRLRRRREAPVQTALDDQRSTD